jgi:hypothetical protein
MPPGNDYTLWSASEILYSSEATKPELLNSLRAASKLASLKQLMLLFLHFVKKLYGFSAKLL